MRLMVVAAGLLGGLGVVGLAAANIPPTQVENSRSVAAMQPQTPEAEKANASPASEVRHIKKRKAKPKAGSTGAKIALPAQCAGGKPNISARPYC